MALAFHVLCPGLGVEASVPPGPHSGLVVGCWRWLSNCWMTLSVVVQSYWFQYWVKKTSLFFHPVDLWSILGLGSGLDLGSTGLDELLAVEGMVGGCGKLLGAAEVGHACTCGTGAAYGLKIGIGIGCGMLAGSPHPGPGWTVLGAVACCGCHPATGWVVLGAGACCGAIGC